jgi:hypothetical protein
VHSRRVAGWKFYATSSLFVLCSGLCQSVFNVKLTNLATRESIIIVNQRWLLELTDVLIMGLWYQYIFFLFRSTKASMNLPNHPPILLYKYISNTFSFSPFSQRYQKLFSWGAKWKTHKLFKTPHHDSRNLHFRKHWIRDCKQSDDHKLNIYFESGLSSRAQSSAWSLELLGFKAWFTGLPLDLDGSLLISYFQDEIASGYKRAARDDLYLIGSMWLSSLSLGIL